MHLTGLAETYKMNALNFSYPFILATWPLCISLQLVLDWSFMKLFHQEISARGI